MADQSTQQRLAAVLAADVVGYTRLMEEDAEGTVAAWQAARDGIIHPAVANSSGRIVKLTGDGFLAEFPTVHEAVNCAIAIQAGLASSALDFRIGVNLGDIIDDGEDIHGEGINVAARLEGLAEPGGICISGDVYNQVRNRIDAPYQDMGEQDVKNVSSPVRVYAIRPGDGAARTQPEEQPIPDKPSIAVLPFDNMSDDAAQEYFSDGITEDIITELSKISGVFVIARHSSFTYKGKSVTLKQVGAELGVRYVLEGSVRKSGERLRITAQLIETATDHHIWAERYDRNLEDIFAVQDEVARQVAEALRVALKPGERERLAHVPTQNLEAYDLFVRSRAAPWPPTRINILTAQNAYSRVVGMEPDFAGGYAGKSFTHSLVVQFGHSDDAKADLRIALELAERAVELDDGFAGSFSALGSAYSALGRHDDAIAATRRAIELQPGDADSQAAYGRCLMFAGAGDAAVDAIQTALRLDPQYVDGPYLVMLGRALYLAGRYQDSVDAYIRNEARRGPLATNAFVYWIAAHGHLGQIEEARYRAELARDYLPDFSTVGNRFLRTILIEGEIEAIVEGFRKAGLMEYIGRDIPG
jgi:adenylate cyclase